MQSHSYVPKFGAVLRLIIKPKVIRAMVRPVSVTMWGRTRLKKKV
ncbi:hypothetical protein ACXR0O_15350 [Verrucomicrobiota bacterium sgz303538]